MFWVFSSCKTFLIRNRNNRKIYEMKLQIRCLARIRTSDAGYYYCPSYPLSYMYILNTFVLLLFDFKTIFDEVGPFALKLLFDEVFLSTKWF